ncbi:MAG: tRNA (adenosine(37)-N6)-dimethylallyltransferase MiaA [Bacteroidales bacterium]
MDKELIIIMGPTAVGKTDYSIELAEKLDSPIISCDSRQIYKEMSIGTAVPSEEQLVRVKHYFIHSHSIHDYYTAGKYELECIELLKKLFVNHDKLVMCGGSAMYINALCYGLDDFPEADPELRAKLMKRLEDEGLEKLTNQLKEIDPISYEAVDLANWRRVVRALEVYYQTGELFSDRKTKPNKKRDFDIKRLCLTRPRSELYDRINIRVDMMIESGLFKEASALYKFRNLTALNTVGYKELFEYMDGDISLDRAIELIKRNSRRYAKKQMTWWRLDQQIIIS